MFSWIFILIIAAITTLGLSEVLVAYQKYQMKKEFLKELDESQRQKERSNS